MVVKRHAGFGAVSNYRLWHGLRPSPLRLTAGLLRLAIRNCTPIEIRGRPSVGKRETVGDRSTTAPNGLVVARSRTVATATDLRSPAIHDLKLHHQEVRGDLRSGNVNRSETVPQQRQTASDFHNVFYRVTPETPSWAELVPSSAKCASSRKRSIRIRAASPWDARRAEARARPLSSV